MQHVEKEVSRDGDFRFSLRKLSSGKKMTNPLFFNIFLKSLQHVKLPAWSPARLLFACLGIK
jgi:hypothetical protein